MLIPKGQKPKRNKPKRLQDKGHLDFIRSLPCIACGAPPPSQAHHLLRHVVRGMGLKCGDDMTVSCCHTCHHQIHHVYGDEEAVLGVVSVDCAKELYEASGNRKQAMTVLLKWKNKND